MLGLELGAPYIVESTVLLSFAKLPLNLLWSQGWAWVFASQVLELQVCTAMAGSAFVLWPWEFSALSRLFQVYLKCLLCFYCVHCCVSIVRACACHGTHVEVERHLCAATSLLLPLFFVWDRISLWSPVHPGTQSLDRAALELICLYLPSSGSLLLPLWDLLEPRLPISNSTHPCPLFQLWERILLVQTSLQVKVFPKGLSEILFKTQGREPRNTHHCAHMCTPHIHTSAP